MVAVEERGLQFADGVYEVVKAVDGVPRDLDRHLGTARTKPGGIEHRHADVAGGPARR